MNDARKKLKAKIKARYQQKVKAARKREEKLRPAHLSKMMRAAEAEIALTEEGRDLLKAAAEADQRAAQAKEQRQLWDREEKLEEFRRKRRESLGVDFPD